MIRCEVIKEFTLERFDELENIQRKKIETKGKLYVGDTFECKKELADYLMGNNLKGEIVVKVIEVKPEKEKPIKLDEEDVKVVAEVVKKTTKKTTKKKKEK